MTRFQRGFTLIELLIVVAIISILAAIAVPNFLEAQTRSKVGRMVADTRTVQTALEVYAVDHTSYPPGVTFMSPFFDPAVGVRTYLLTTPIAYISQIPLDIFNSDPNPNLPDGPFGILSEYVGYLNDPMVDEVWLLFSFGPDQVMDDEGRHYDASNGTISKGDIYRKGPRRPGRGEGPPH